MKLILETERLLLRELSVKDASHFYELNNDSEVLNFTGDEPFQNIEQARAFLENYDHYSLYGFGRWAVISKENESFLGWCGLNYSKELDEFDVGFRFFRKYWNQGFATEAAQACVNYGISELKIPEILGRAMKKNAASIKVLEKIGMTYSKDFDFDGNEGAIFSINQLSISKLKPLTTKA